MSVTGSSRRSNQGQPKADEEKKVKFNIKKSLSRLGRNMKNGVSAGAAVGGGVGFVTPIGLSGVIAGELNKLPFGGLVAAPVGLAGLAAGVAVGAAGATAGAAAGAAVASVRSAVKGVGNITGLRERKYQNSVKNSS